MAKPQELIPVNEERAVITPPSMIAEAVRQGASIEVIEKLMGLQERWEANQARKSFDAAISAAKAEMPILTKNKTVDFVGNTGKRTTYKHETLDEVVRTIQPIMSKHGLDTRFRTESAPGFLTVICHVSHRDGYSEENSLTAPVDTSGNKNALQAIGSAQTYLQRYTLKAALGLAAEVDDDGHGATSGPATITPDQAHRLLDRLRDVNADVHAFCTLMKVASVPDIPAARHHEAEAHIKRKEDRVGGRQ